MTTIGKVYAVGENASDFKAIMDSIDACFGATIADVRSKSKTHPYPSIRAIVCVALRESGWTFQHIGEKLRMSGGNAIHHYKAHEGRLEADRDYAASWNAFQENLKTEQHETLITE